MKLVKGESKYATRTNIATIMKLKSYMITAVRKSRYADLVTSVFNYRDSVWPHWIHKHRWERGVDRPDHRADLHLPVRVGRDR